MDAFAREAFSLLGVGSFVICLRMYVRLSLGGLKGLHADDYLMVAYAVETYLAYSVGSFWEGLANNAMTDEQRQLLDPNSEEYRLRVNGSKTQIAGWSTYTLVLWIIKAAMCSFYLRLTDGLGFETRIYAGFAFILSSWIAVILSILLSCRPLEKNWQIYPNPGNSCQPAISRIDIFVTVVLNVLTDLYLMSIPIPMLWKASLRPFKKAGLMLLFSGGIFVTVAGVLRCVLIITNPVNGAEQAGSWAVRETFVAVVTSNLPMISPLITQCFRPLFASFRSLSASRANNNNNNNYNYINNNNNNRASRFNSRRGDDGNPRRGMGPRSVHPIPTNFSVHGSDELICGGGGGRRHDEDEAATAGEMMMMDLEAGRAGRTVGGIMKQTEVEIIEMRKSHVGELTDGEDIGDYYLVQQLESKRDAEGAGRKTAVDKGHRRASVSFGGGKGL